MTFWLRRTILNRCGGRRLLVTPADGKTIAAFCRPTVPGTPADRRVAFSSPWRTIYFDSVEDVSQQIQFAAAKFSEDVTIRQEDQACVSRVPA